MQLFLSSHVHYINYINYRAECYTLSKLQPQGASPTEDTDSSMAASVQLEQTSAGHFGRVDSGSDRDTQGIAYAIVAGLPAQVGKRYERTCYCVLAAHRFPSATVKDIRIKLSLSFFSVNDNSPKNRTN